MFEATEPSENGHAQPQPLCLLTQLGLSISEMVVMEFMARSQDFSIF